MHKKNFLFKLLLVSFFVILSACGKNIDGKYNMYQNGVYNIGEGETLIELTIDDKDAKMKLNYYDIEIESSNFFNISPKISQQSQEFKGKVDKSKKSIEIPYDGEKLVLTYKIQKKTLVLTEKDTPEDTLTFYNEGTDDYEKNRQEFLNQEDELVGSEEDNYDEFSDSMSKGLNNEVENNSVDVAIKGSEKTGEKYSGKEVEVVAEKIKKDFLKKITGDWVAETIHPNEIKATASIDKAQKFSAEVINNLGPKNSRTEANYQGEFDFTESTAIEKEINKMLTEGNISSIDEVDTYDKYSLRSSTTPKFEMKFIISVEELRGGELVKDESDKESVVTLKLSDNHINFQNVLNQEGVSGVDRILHFAK